MTLDKIYNKLHGNLYKPLLFFIPSSLLPIENEVVALNTSLTEALDKVYYIDKKGQDYSVNTSESLHPILQKAAILEKNILLLLEQQNKLSKTGFKFLLDKYEELLYFYVETSIKLAKNINELPINDGKAIVVYFEMQRDAFQQHQNTFEKYFPSKNVTLAKPLDWSNYSEKDLPPIRHLSIVQTEKKRTTRKKKKIILTDLEAREYLLETVFNINMG